LRFLSRLRAGESHLTICAVANQEALDSSEDSAC
jgi:hypothetical protein